MGRYRSINGIVSIGLRECNAIEVLRHEKMSGIQRINDSKRIVIAIRRLGNDVKIAEIDRINHSHIIAELMRKNASAVCLMYFVVKLRIDFCSRYTTLGSRR